MRRMRTSWVLLMFCLAGLSCLKTVSSASEENATSSEVEIETFEHFEKNFKGKVGDIVKKILPFLLKGGSNTKISGPCTSSIMKIIGGVRSLREWAMRFLDASGKIPAGILEGTSLALGDYDECLDIEVPKRDAPPKTPEDILFRGKYCLLENHRPEAVQRAIDDFQNGNTEATIAKTKTFLNLLVRYKHLSNSTFKLGACIPSKCTSEDIESILSSESLQQFGKITVSYCDVLGDQEKKSEHLYLVSFLGIIVGCVTLATIADIYLRFTKNDKEEKAKPSTFLQRIINSTSLYNNAINVLSTKNPEESLPCLCGIRALTVIVLIFSHTYAHLHTMHFQKFGKSANFVRFFENFFFSGIANGSVGVDSIVFVAAVTLTYKGWRFLPDNGKANPSILKTFLLRYFRMSAAQVITICIFLLFPLLGSGPLWHAYNDLPLELCRQRWWINFIYLDNFWRSTQICLYHTWILALVMQLTILGLVTMWILKKSPKYGISFMIVIILAGIISVGALIIIHELPGSMAFFMLNIKTFPIAWRKVYTRPYDHMGPFCIGLLVGYFLAIKKDKLEISKLTSVGLWCLSIACNVAVMFGLYNYRHGDKMDLTLSTLYAVLHRNVWALGIGWLVIACTTHHGGAVSRVLKSKLFVPLDRLCYMAFMLHIPIMYFHSGMIRQMWFMGHLELFFLGVAYNFMSYFCAFLIHILFAEPYFALEEQVSSYFKRKNKINFEPKVIPPQNTVIFLEDASNHNNCVNVGYSKTSNGI